MNPQSTRPQLVIPAAIIIAAILIAVSISVAVGGERTTTVTVTPTNSTGEVVYKVTFQQVQYCGLYNILPWAVTVGGLTQVQPSNQTLPLPTNTFSTVVPDQSLTRMTFYLPPGAYSYIVYGGSGNGPGGQLYPTSGTFQVVGSNLVLNEDVYLSFTCAPTTSSIA